MMALLVSVKHVNSCFIYILHILSIKYNTRLYFNIFAVKCAELVLKEGEGEFLICNNNSIHWEDY